MQTYIQSIYDLTSNFNDSANLVLRAALLCVFMVCLSGCDLGTYNKRLIDRAPAPKTEPEAEGDADAAAENGGQNADQGAGQGGGGGGLTDRPF